MRWFGGGAGLAARQSPLTIFGMFRAVDVERHRADDDKADSAGPFGGEASPAFWGRAQPPNDKIEPLRGCGLEPPQ